MICVIHINYIFQAKYNSIVTVPQYEKRINSLKKLLDSDLTPMIHKIFNPFIVRLTNDSMVKLFYEKAKTFATDSATSIDIMMKHNNIAKTIHREELTTSDRYYFDTFEDSLFVNVDMGYLVRKGSALLPSINEVIRGINEGGLIKKWIDDYTNVTTYKTDTDFIVLSLEDILLSKLIICFGLLISFVIFIIELIIGYLININRI